MDHQFFQKDKRLQNLDPRRLDRLLRMADRLSNAPENQKMSVFLSLMQEMQASKLTFSKEEQELLFFILTENMDEKEKKKAAMIRQLSAQFTQRK